jgi:tryptophan halogenase
MQNPIKKVVIAGGGTAGWMTAALMQKVLHTQVEIELVESEDIGIVGVGEATIPPIQVFNQFLGLDEKEFLRETKATIKLGIQFDNWRHKGHRYFHTFGAPGAALGFCNFQHYWLKAHKQGLKQSLWDFDLNYLCCKNEVFNKINTQNPVYEVPYAYHFDSSLYGKYLRKIAEKAGVKRTEGIIEHVAIDQQSGFVKGLQLNNGKQIEGDLFIDCTGTRALLIQKTLGVEYVDWSHLLPANTALAVQTKRFDKTLPYTRSIAHEAGWQWRIPLTHRNGNGIVFSSDYLTDDQAQRTLLGNLASDPVTDVRKISFKTGRTSKQWHKNVIAVGLAGGFLEPLESTSIHLIQSAIVRLLKLFPHNGIRQSAVNVFNAESATEYDTIRDFIVLHYVVNERDDSDFWQDMRRLTLPPRLQQKIDVFKEVGAIFNDQHDIFKDASWLQVMMGQGLMPQDYHPAADLLSEQQLMDAMHKIAHAKMQPMTKMLPHDEFIKQYVGA